MTYGTSISTATFVDCHWDVSEMVYLVHNLYFSDEVCLPVFSF